MSASDSALPPRATASARMLPAGEPRREAELRGGGSPTFPRRAANDDRDARPQPRTEVPIPPRAVEPRCIVDIELRPDPDGERGPPEDREIERRAEKRSPHALHVPPGFQGWIDVPARHGQRAVHFCRVASRAQAALGRIAAEDV